MRQQENAEGRLLLPVRKHWLSVLFWCGFILTPYVTPLSWAEEQCGELVTYTLKIEQEEITPSQMRQSGQTQRGRVTPSRMRQRTCLGRRESQAFSVKCGSGITGTIPLQITGRSRNPLINFQRTIQVPCKLTKCSDLGAGWQDQPCVSGQCQKTANIQISGEPAEVCNQCLEPESPPDNCGCTEGVATLPTNDTEHCEQGCVEEHSRKICQYQCPAGSSWAGGVGPRSQEVYCCKHRKGEALPSCKTTSCSTASAGAETGKNCINPGKVDCKGGTMGEQVTCFCGLKATQNPSVPVCTDITT